MAIYMFDVIGHVYSTLIPFHANLLEIPEVSTEEVLATVAIWNYFRLYSTLDRLYILWSRKVAWATWV